jgi:hypothetical protein
MTIRKIFAAVCLVAQGGIAAAQCVFNFDAIPGVDDAPTMAFDISPIMLGFVRGMLAGVEPETAAMLQDLRSIRLRVYNASENNRQFNNFVDNVTKELEDNNWQSVMFVRDATTNVRVHMRMTETLISGITVMLIDNTEAVFLNIDGSISAEDLGQVLAVLQAQGIMPQVEIPLPGPGSAAAAGP